MAKDRAVRRRALERVAADDFADRNCRAIFKAFAADPELSGPSAGMDPVVTLLMEQLFTDQEELIHPIKMFEESLARHELERLERRRQDLDSRMAEAVNADERARLRDAKMELQPERAALSRGAFSPAHKLAQMSKNEGDH